MNKFIREMRITPVTIEIIIRANSVFKDAKVVHDWLMGRNEVLGNMSPYYMINRGREHRVLELIVEELKIEGGKR